MAIVHKEESKHTWQAEDARKAAGGKQGTPRELHCYHLGKHDWPPCQLCSHARLAEPLATHLADCCMHALDCQPVKSLALSTSAVPCIVNDQTEQRRSHIRLGLAADVALLQPQHVEGWVQSQDIMLSWQVLFRRQEQQTSQSSCCRQEAAFLGFQRLQNKWLICVSMQYCSCHHL